MTQTYLMWGKGGRIRQDGPDDIRLQLVYGSVG